jgi:NAD(P)-dependent dehydrogenase (short-subunit alcohol dehydrogenase family)
MESVMDLQGKTAVVTGGSRGLGLGGVEALAGRGARVWVVARDAAALQAVGGRLGVEVIPADITDAAAAARILAEVRPDILVLNAGALPAQGPLDQLSWEDFTRPWEVDVKGGFHWLQAALNLPLAPGSRILVGSSGAARQGSPQSGGYAGAKRMLWMMAKYADQVSERKGLGVRVQAVAPLQMVAGTGVGEAGAAAYGLAAGVDPEAILAGYPSMPPRVYGEHLVSILTDPQYDRGAALGLRGDTGITILEERTAA